MARLDVFRLKSGGLALDCQADLLDFLSTRLVVPLLDPAAVPGPVGRLHPLLTVGEAELLMATHLATAVDLGELGEPIASLADQAEPIGNALDMLLVGF